MPIDILIESAFNTRDRITSKENQLKSLIENKIKLGFNRLEFSASEINNIIQQQQLINDLQQELLVEKNDLEKSERDIREIFVKADLKREHSVIAEINNQRFSCTVDDAKKVIIRKC